MRRLLTWVSGAAGGIVAYRLFTRRRAVAGAPEPEPQVDPRAEELRAKLEASRAIVDEQERFESAEQTVDESDPEERRRRVHEEGRATVERMRRAGGES